MVQSKQTKRSHSAKKNAIKQKSKRTTIDKIKKIAYQYGIPLAAVASAATAFYLASLNAEQTYSKGQGSKKKVAAPQKKNQKQKQKQKQKQTIT